MNQSPVSPPTPCFETAGQLLEALGAADFEHLASAFEVDASLSALLPGGFRGWEGSTAISAAFERWFGNVEEFELADSSIGQVGERLQMHWRLRLRGPRFGDDPMVVEQHVYATTGPNDRLQHMSLLCSGFWPEPADAQHERKSND